MVRLGSTVARLKLKGIDGDPHKQRSVWFNSMQREEPYQDLTWRCTTRNGVSLRGVSTGAAWLSSARAVRCWVKSRNERNPCRRLLFPTRLPRSTGRKVGMTSSQHGPYILGHTHATMAGTKGGQPARGSQSHKTGLSSDCRLQPACMKLELLVTAHQHGAVNMFPGLVHTARHVMGAGNT